MYYTSHHVPRPVQCFMNCNGMLPHNNLSQVKVYLDCQAQSYACVGTLVPLLLVLPCIAPRLEWDVHATTWSDLESMTFGPLQDSMPQWWRVCDTAKEYILLTNLSMLTIQNSHVANQVQRYYPSERGCATLGQPPACLQVQECQSQYWPGLVASITLRLLDECRQSTLSYSVCSDLAYARIS